MQHTGPNPARKFDMEELLNFLAFLAICIVIYFAVHRFWRATAIRAVNDWARENGYETDGTSGFIFKMGRPAHISTTLTREGYDYKSEFELHSGFTAMPSSIFGVWGKVVLVSSVKLSRDHVQNSHGMS